MIEQTRLVPLAPPSPMAPAISPARNRSSSFVCAPSVTTAAASWRDRSLNACHVTPAAAATAAPVTSAPSTSCGRKDKSTVHDVAPARARTSAMKRASLPLVSSVANTATAGFDALKEDPREALSSIEPVIEPGAHDLVGNAGIECGGKRHVQLIVHAGRYRAEVHVQVFDLAGPVANEASLDPAANRPAGVDGDVAERIGGRGAGGIEAEQVTRGTQPGTRRAPGNKDNGIGCDHRPEAPTQGSEPLQSLILIKRRKHRSSRIADRARTGEYRGVVLS